MKSKKEVVRTNDSLELTFIAVGVMVIASALIYTSALLFGFNIQ